MLAVAIDSNANVAEVDCASQHQIQCGLCGGQAAILSTEIIPDGKVLSILAT
jgi:hypothetical protein